MNTINVYKIAETNNLTSKAAAVLQCLAAHSNKNHEAWPKLKTVAKETRLSVSTVQRGLDELLSMGIITKKHNYRADGGQTSNIYRIVWAVAERAAAAAENAMLKLRDLRKRMEYAEAAKETKLQIEIDFPPADKKTFSLFTRIFQHFSSVKEFLTSPPVQYNYPRT